MKNQPPRFYGGNLKTKKTNNMPLGPKQQPPYYVAEPIPTPPTGGAFERLNAQYNTVITSGTAEQTLYEYNIPANTITQNGDQINILFVSSNTAGNGDSHLHRLYIDNIVQLGTENTISPNDNLIEIKLIRISTTEVKMIMQSYASTPITNIKPTLNIQTVNLLDFTSIIPIKITGQCTNLGVIQTYFITIDKITI